jgi:hypothetical protein
MIRSFLVFATLLLAHVSEAYPDVNYKESGRPLGYHYVLGDVFAGSTFFDNFKFMANDYVHGKPIYRNELHVTN